MTRALTLLVTVLALAAAAGAQGSLHDAAPLGSHQVGFFTALVADDAVAYAQYGYDGPAPRFVQVWYPLAAPGDGEPSATAKPPGAGEPPTAGEPPSIDEPSATAEPPSAARPLTFGQLRERELPQALARVYAELRRQVDAGFIAYDLTERADDGAPIDWSPHTAEEVLAALKDSPTVSLRARPGGPLNVPVIVYHHGTQGRSDENVVMAEFFASRGYAFVAADFHLPYDGVVFGLTEAVAPGTSALHAVLRFARGLAGAQPVVMIGHSWGAQVGWRSLHEPGLADAFVSLETTLEAKTDPAEIEDKWPFLYEAFTVRDQTLAIPVLHVANTRRDEPFPYFVGRSTVDMLQVSARASFGHDSYTSAFLMRRLVRERFPQPDEDALEQQWRLYTGHLLLIEAFLDALWAEQEFPASRFTDAFHVMRVPGREAAPR